MIAEGVIANVVLDINGQRRSFAAVYSHVWKLRIEVGSIDLVCNGKSVMKR